MISMENGHIEVGTLVLGIARTRTYIISDKNTKEAIVFDPADEAELIEAYLKDKELHLDGIFITHGHFDHILAADQLRDDYKAKIYIGEKENDLLLDTNKNMSRISGLEKTVEADVLLRDNEELTACGLKIHVIETPGHTAGGVSYYLPELSILISGDTLFKGTIGRTDLPTSDYSAIISSIKTKLLPLPDETKVLPGHGDSSTIGYEKQNNPFVL